MPTTLSPKTQQSRTHYRRTTCILCGSSKLTLALPLSSTPVGNDYVPVGRLDEDQEYFGLNLNRCEACGNVQLEDVVNREILFRNYIYSTAHSLGLVEHFRSVAREYVNHHRLPPGALAIDIGSNDGSLLRALQSEGMRVLGVDPAVDLARAATDSGVPTLPEFFTCELADRIRQEYGPGRLVTANNVFAHSDKLPEMADGIRTLLDRDGVFTFEVSYLLDIVQKMLFDTIYHEHLCYHSVRSLSEFFAQHGMELVGVERIHSKGGSLRGTVQVKGGPHTVAPAVGGLIELEDCLNLHSPATWDRYRRAVDENRLQVNELLARLKGRGKTLCGYGASPTVTTLLHHYDIADKLEFLLDDNAVKQNTFSPGQHLPVYASDHLYKKPVDFVVVLAWQYVQPIAKRHQRYAESGGRFIVPLPNLQVL